MIKKIEIFPQKKKRKKRTKKKVDKMEPIHAKFCQHI